MGTDFRKLEAYTACDDLLVTIYEITGYLPSDERFGLVSQMRRAAVSAVANIAEGFGRSTQRERVRFLDICLGSLNELESYFLVCRKLDLLDSSQLEPVRDKHSRAAALVTGLRRKLSKT